jgi:hypothetical protein
MEISDIASHYENSTIRGKSDADKFFGLDKSQFWNATKRWAQE